MESIRRCKAAQAEEAHKNECTCGGHKTVTHTNAMLSQCKVSAHSPGTILAGGVDSITRNHEQSVVNETFVSRMLKLIGWDKS